MSEANTQVAYLKGPGGSALSFKRGQWYKVVVSVKFDHVGTGGRVEAWVDNAKAADWTGQVGYTPASIGGQAGTTDGTSVEIGLYQTKTDTNHKLFLDEMRYADTFFEAQP